MPWMYVLLGGFVFIPHMLQATDEKIEVTDGFVSEAGVSPSSPKKELAFLRLRCKVCGPIVSLILRSRFWSAFVSIVLSQELETLLESSKKTFKSKSKEQAQQIKYLQVNIQGGFLDMKLLRWLSFKYQTLILMLTDLFVSSAAATEPSSCRCSNGGSCCCDLAPKTVIGARIIDEPWRGAAWSSTREFVFESASDGSAALNMSFCSVDQASSPDRKGVGVSGGHKRFVLTWNAKHFISESLPRYSALIYGSRPFQLILVERITGSRRGWKARIFLRLHRFLSDDLARLAELRIEIEEKEYEISSLKVCSICGFNGCHLEQKPNTLGVSLSSWHAAPRVLLPFFECFKALQFIGSVCSPVSSALCTKVVIIPILEA